MKCKVKHCDDWNGDDPSELCLHHWSILNKLECEEGCLDHIGDIPISEWEYDN
jgi:hypothetical protein